MVQMDYDDKCDGDVDGDIYGDMAVPAWRKREGRKESGSCHRSGEK